MNKRSYTIFSLILGLVIFTYVLLRALWVEPIHDEIATLFHYIDFGTFWGKDMLIDANNHLLNSFLAKVCYSLFGDHIWAIRLPNVFSFILFFYAAYKISLLLKVERLRPLFLIAVTCIPYVLDYFAYCRGYGMSMAFFFYAFYLFLLLNQRFRLFQTALLMVSLLLCCYANLNMMIVTGLMLGYLGIKLLLQEDHSKKWKNFLQFLGMGILFMALMYVPVSFAFLLKNSGALYYGSDKGLWLTTGASLSEMVLYTSSVVIKYVLMVLLITFIGWAIYKWKQHGSTFLFLQNATLWIGILLGNIVAILLLNWFLGVHYPEDRVGMQLIFLLVGACFFTLDEWPKGAWLGLVFLVFPIVGWKSFNFYSSVFSPDDRMEQADFDFLMKKTPFGTSSAVYMTQQLVYAYHIRKNNPEHIIVPEESNSHRLSFIHDDVISTKIEFVPYFDSVGYKVLRTNKASWQVIMARKQPFQWRAYFDTNRVKSEPIQSSDQFYNLANIDVTKEHHPLKIAIQCKVNTPYLRRENLVLVVDKSGKNGKRIYETFNLAWAAGKRHTYWFDKTITLFPKTLTDFRMYLYNPKKMPFKIMSHRIIKMRAEN